MNKRNRRAFTMLELTFVIVVIGILSAIAVPKFAATRDDASISSALSVVASVRSSLTMERQKRMLRGEFTKVTAVGDTTNVFGNFYVGSNSTGTTVLEYPIKSEKRKYKWYFKGSNWYGFCLNDACTSNSDAVWYRVLEGKFECKAGDCTILE